MKKLGMVVVGWLLAMGLAFAQININTASQEELDGLKGIGPTRPRRLSITERKMAHSSRSTIWKMCRVLARHPQGSTFR